MMSSAESADLFIWGRNKFIEEAKMLAWFSHPGIVKVLSIFEANNTAYMVLEFVAGLTLEKLAATEQVTPERLMRMTGKLLDARLSVGQVVALRFASDGEFVELARRAADQGMSPDDIKKAVQNWRADTHRV